MLNFNSLLKLRGFPISKARKIGKEIPSSEHLIEWQEGKKWEIFNFHFKHNPYYLSLNKEKPSLWKEIPILTKKELRIDTTFNKYDISNRMYIRNTSGSTGNPFTYALDYTSHALTWLLIEDRYKKAEISLNNHQARFYGLPINFNEKWRERTKDLLSKRYRFSLMDLSDKALLKWIAIFNTHSFSYIYGYSFPITAFAKFLIKNNIALKNICPSLKSVIVTAEMCPTENEKIIEQAIGVPVWNEYGASEIGIIGFGKSNNWQISDELIYVEIVDDQGNTLPDGELGRIICTPLFNKGTPFIRYDVGDIGALKTTPNGKILTRLEGRREEFMILPSGKKLPGDTFFFYIMKDFAKKFPPISEYRIIQRDIDSFDILITSDKKLQDSYSLFLQKLIKQKIDDPININIMNVDNIERTRLGKFRRFISEIKNH